MASMRYLFIGLALKAISVTRADRLLAGRLAGEGVILTFHHVRLASDRIFPENRLLEITPAFLEAVIRELRDLDYEIIPLDVLKSRLGTPGKRFAVLTFDDGYFDTRDYALPILKRHEAPFTVFVTPGFAERTTALWWLDLEDAVRARDNIEVQLPSGRFVHPTRTPDDQRAGFKRLYWALRELPEPVLREIVATMAADAGIDTLGRVARLCMDWGALRDFAREPLVTIGAHSMTHPRLKTLSDEASQAEIIESKERVEKEIGKAVRHFAYPVGDPTSAGVREFAFARAAGFETGVTTRPGVVFAEHAPHLLALPRISVNGLFQNIDFVRGLVSGLPSAAVNRGRRLNIG
ncbi:MAG: polysaccharide deacetylase family protein [Rhizobiales bacterium]|mgnify:CR=1 FL=1|nr:polysaccharide deacetylase family protein [Hyphomicrobiales bacterium]